MARIHMKLPVWCQHILHTENHTQKCYMVSVSLVFSVVFVLVLLLDVSLSWTHENSPDKYNPKFRRKAIIQEPTDTEDPTLHYGIVIDCGSSGSRVFVYYWPVHSGNPKELLQIRPMLDHDLKPVVKKVEPGIAAYAGRPDDVSDYVRPLLDHAASHIPEERHHETTLYILATAGMRLLPESVQEAVLADLREDVPKLYSFLVADNHFEVITGKQEGVYAWVAINYALGKFQHSDTDTGSVNSHERPHLRPPTVGMIDMGGASVQIAFEVPQNAHFSIKDEKAKLLLAEFSLGCQTTDLDHSYRVYVATFLNYGANSAIDTYHEGIVGNAETKNRTENKHSSDNSHEISDPCLPRNLIYEIPDDKSGTQHTLHGTGDYAVCRAVLVSLVNTSAACMTEPCSMKGVFQPEIDYKKSKFYGFSEFWYTMEDVFRMGGLYSHDTFDAAAKTYCQTDWSTLQSWYDQNLYPKAVLYRFQFQCFKSAWMSVILHEGLKFPKTYKHFQSTQYIHNEDVHWSLGALIHRTRYMPLREIEKLHAHHQHDASISRLPWLPWRLAILDNGYIIIFCAIIVIAAILLYMQRLRLCPHKNTDFRRVPSIAYFADLAVPE